MREGTAAASAVVASLGVSVRNTALAGTSDPGAFDAKPFGDACTGESAAPDVARVRGVAVPPIPSVCDGGSAACLEWLLHASPAQAHPRQIVIASRSRNTPAP